MDGSENRYAVGVLTMDQTMNLWPQWSKLFAPLLEQEGCYLPVDLLPMLNAQPQTTHLWAAWDGISSECDAFMVTMLCTFPRKKWLNVPFIAGRNMKRWKAEFWRLIEAQAKKEGCTEIRGASRRGWIKAAGFTECGVLLRRELAHG